MGEPSDSVEKLPFPAESHDPQEKSRGISQISRARTVSHMKTNDQNQIIEYKRQVLDKGFIRLDDYMANDLKVVNSARVSVDVRHEEMEDGDEGLIRYLMREKHGTPFEHNAFTLHIKAPISVFREWQRHRIASYNELSARYKEMKPEFYVPALEDIRTQVGKPGHYTYEPVETGIAIVTQSAMIFAYSNAFAAYESMLSNGVAKELARQVLPVGLYSQMYWTTNARSMMNFLSLRNASNAMLEIRRYAEVVEDIFKRIMPVTAQAFIDNGRVAP